MQELQTTLARHFQIGQNQIGKVTGIQAGPGFGHGGGSGDAVSAPKVIMEKGAHHLVVFNDQQFFFHD